MKWETIAIVLLVGVVVLVLLWPRPGPPVPPSPPPAVQITTEGATAVWDVTVQATGDLGPLALTVRPRIALDHAATCSRSAFSPSAALSEVAMVVRPRLTLHYAATSAHAALVRSGEVVGVAQIRQRFVIEGAATSELRQDLQGSARLVEETQGVGPRIVLQDSSFGGSLPLLKPPWEGEVPTR